MKNSTNKESNPYYDASIQKSLKKLISEEWFAGQMYKLFINAVDIKEQHLIAGIMETTAEDELNDHLKNLVEVAVKFGYDVPSTFSEFERYAGKEDSKAFKTFKDNKDAETYLKLAYESEVRAVNSYKEALDNDKLCICQEVSIVFGNNYYDEIEHLQQFDFLLKTLDINAEIQIIRQDNEQ